MRIRNLFHPATGIDIPDPQNCPQHHATFCNSGVSSDTLTFESGDPDQSKNDISHYLGYRYQSMYTQYLLN